MSGVVDQLIEKLDNFLGRLLYAIERIVCLFISWLQQLFGVFTGITPAKYNNNDEYLINVFFGNKVVNAIYWGMAAIGIVMVFIFTIMAVTRKGFDLDDKMRQSHGQILRSFMRSIFIIISLSLFMTITINFTNVLMDSVNDVFNNSTTLVDSKTHIEYTKEQFAAMGRIFNTVGNYSLNPSSNNRYNLNTCYNEIRADLKYLSDTGVFDYYYTGKENGEDKNTWQSVLQELATAADFNKEQPVDKYEESIANALNHCKQVLMNDYSFHALEEYDRTRQYNKDEVSLDRVLFLSGTMGIGNNAAAKNDAFNKNPDMLDNVRAPYYTGDKSIYDLDQVNEDFYVSFTRMNYLLIYLVGIAIVVNMAIIIVNCIVRIFNLLFLYIIAPPIIAVSPLDDGGKFKQWLTAFIIQAFSVFATVISMRIFLIFVPIVMSPSLQLTENSVISTMGKLVMIWAGTVAIEKANGLLTGILADNAGWQSIMAGSTAQDVKGSTVGRLASAAQSRVEGAAAAPVTAVAGKAMGLAKGTLGAVGRTAALPFRPLVGAISNTASRVSTSFGGIEDKLSNSVVSSPEALKRQSDAKERQQADQERNENRNFRNAVGGYLASQAAKGNQPPPPRRAGSGESGQPANSSQLPSSAAGVGNKGPYNKAVQNLFGIDADGNVKSSGSGAADGSAGSGSAGGGAGQPANKSQLPSSAAGVGKKGPYSAAEQNLFGVDANGNVRNSTGSAAGRGAAGTGSAAGGAASGSAATGAAVIGAADSNLPRRSPDPRMQALLNRYKRDDSPGGGAVGGAADSGSAGSGAANHSRQLDPEVQKLFDGGNDALPHNQGDLAQQNRELDSMLSAVGIDPGNGSGGSGVLPQKEPINIPPEYYNAQGLDANEKAMLPYDELGNMKSPSEVNKAVKLAERAQEPSSGSLFYGEMLDKMRDKNGNIKPPPKRNDKP